MASAALRILLAELIDYAGLFPPAALPMAAAVRGYASYRASADAWALGRFVVPVARLDELAQTATSLGADGEWHISALLGNDVTADLDVIRAFNDAHRGRLVIDVVEARTPTPDAVATASQATMAGLTVYAEVPVADDPATLIDAIARAGVRAKIRTGGVETSAFPTAAQVARFIHRCAVANVSFKATAGLHHPVRAEYPLSYAPDAPTGTMFGFLNVFVAAALARIGASESALTRVLEERDPRAFVLADDVVRWREHALPVTALADARANFAIAFGSCSFREPLDDLQHLGLL
jgi:hypothetical protein